MIVVGLSVLEDELGIEELLIDVLRGIVPAADDEDFGWNESWGFGFCCLYSGEEFFEHPHEGLEVCWPEDLGDEVAAVFQKIAGEFQCT